MKFTVLNKVIQVTAENDSDNLILIKLSEATPLNKEAEKPTKVVVGNEVVRRSKYKKSKRTHKLGTERKAKLSILREQVFSIPVGSAGFVTTEVASATKNLQSYNAKVIAPKHPQAPVRIKAYKRFGGYEVAVVK